MKINNEEWTLIAGKDTFPKEKKRCKMLVYCEGTFEGPTADGQFNFKPDRRDDGSTIIKKIVAWKEEA